MRDKHRGLQNPEFQEKLRNASTPQELLSLAKEAGFDLTEEQLQAANGGVTWDCWDIEGCLDVYEIYQNPYDWCQALFS